MTDSFIHSVPWIELAPFFDLPISSPPTCPPFPSGDWISSRSDFFLRLDSGARGFLAGMPRSLLLFLLRPLFLPPPDYKAFALAV